MSSSSSLPFSPTSAIEPPSKRQKLEDNKPAVTVASATAADSAAAFSNASNAATKSSVSNKNQKLKQKRAAIAAAAAAKAAEAEAEAVEKKRRAREKRERNEEEEKIAKEKKQKEEADELRAKNALIQSVYSDEMKASIREHLITSDDIAIPNVLADLILEYTHHPLLQLWESIEAECQSHDPDRIEKGDMPFIEYYVRGLDEYDSRAEGVQPSRINELETEFRDVMKDPSFSLPDDLKILWSIRDGFDEVKWSSWCEYESTDQFLLSSILFPSIGIVERNVNMEVSLRDRALHASYCILDATGDGGVYILKYHLREGCITEFHIDNELGDTWNSMVVPDKNKREKAAHEFLTKSPPRIVFHSLHHYLGRLLDLLVEHGNPKYGCDAPAFHHSSLYEREGKKDMNGRKKEASDNEEDEEEKKDDEDMQQVNGVEERSSLSLSSSSSSSPSKPTSSYGRLTPAELKSMNEKLTWQLEFPMLCELFSLAENENENRVVQIYYQSCTLEHGCRLFQAP